MIGLSAEDLLDGDWQRPFCENVFQLSIVFQHCIDGILKVILISLIARANYISLIERERKSQTFKIRRIMN